MINSTWTQKEHDRDLALSLKKELGISPLLSTLLSLRIKSLEEARYFLNPSLKELSDPYVFAGMKEAIVRVAKAIENNERIGLFGDYDVDGVSSTAILEQFLKSIKARVQSTLPNRLKEGYGLSFSGVDRLKDTSLIITLDCGVLAYEQITYANSLGIDVIVIDHHTVGQELPEALCVINPKRNDCPSMAQYLCAAGVTFFFIMGLRRELRTRGFFKDIAEPDLRELLDLVALASVCDVVPLIKHNRVLVKAGLKSIREQNRVGIKALLEILKIDAQKISSTNLGFHLGPRINAAGRLEDATMALKLLSIKNSSEAKSLAEMIHNINEERKELEHNTVQEASLLVEKMPELPKAIVLHDERWHPGVVGIVASRIAERFHRPTIIIGEKGKGSGRSIKGIDLHEMVSKASHTLVGFGGHAHAIGVSIKNDGVLSFRESLNEAMNTAKCEIFNKVVFYDACIQLKDICLELAQEITSLEPFGPGNPCPILRIDRCTFKNVKRLNGGHLKGELEYEGDRASFIAFRTEIDDALLDSRVDILAVLEKNEWLGRISAQLRIIDFKESTCALPQ